MASITIDTNTTQVRAMLQAAPDQVDKRIKTLLSVAAIATQREMRIAAPIAVTGDLRKSIKYEITDNEAIIGPTAMYANAIEFGSRPRWVSVKAGSPLREWADMKGINPYAVQQSIAKKGTKEHPFVQPTHTLMAPRIDQIFDTGFAALARELENG